MYTSVLQAFNNASVPASAQATFPYIFAVSKYLQVCALYCTVIMFLFIKFKISPLCILYNHSHVYVFLLFGVHGSIELLLFFYLKHYVHILQPGTFDLVGTIIYEIDQSPYQSTFYNGTIEVVEAGGFLSIESVFLVTLGIALLFLFGLWVHGQIQHLSKVLIFHA